MIVAQDSAAKQSNAKVKLTHHHIRMIFNFSGSQSNAITRNLILLLMMEWKTVVVWSGSFWVRRTTKVIKLGKLSPFFNVNFSLSNFLLLLFIRFDFLFAFVFKNYQDKRYRIFIRIGIKFVLDFNNCNSLLFCCCFLSCGCLPSFFDLFSEICFYFDRMNLKTGFKVTN